MVVCSKCDIVKDVPFVIMAVKSSADDELKVFVRFHGSPCCQFEVQSYLNAVGDIYAKEKPFSILYDASKIGLPTAGQLRSQISFMRAHDQQTQEFVRKVAIVVSSVTARKMLNGIFMLKPPACPMEICSDLQSAKTYLQKEV